MKIFIVCALILLCGYVFFHKEPYDPTFYPHKSNLITYLRIDGLVDLDACRAAARNLAASYSSNSDYECATGFIKDMGDGLRMYKTTTH